MTDNVVSITGDLWPRDNPDYRYRVYTQDPDGKPACLFTSPTPEGMGLALVTVMREHLEAGGEARVVGVLDATEGKWLTSMWAPSAFGKARA